MIAPSDEDSFTFSVSAANGDIFKLRGNCLSQYFKHNLVIFLLCYQDGKQWRTLLFRILISNTMFNYNNLISKSLINL